MTFQNLMHFGPQFCPDVIVEARGVFLYTSSGRKLLDWTGSQMCCLLGHGHPELVNTIHEHARNLDHLLSYMVSPPILDLAQRLVDLTPCGLDKAMFLSTGSESVEAAIRIAKLHTGKYEIVALGSSWHGMTAAALSAQYHEGRKGYGPTMPGNFLIPPPDEYRSMFKRADGTYDWEAELEYGWSLVDQMSCGSLCAVILEPVLSSGGMLVLPQGYIRKMQTYCRRRGMLLILDEAQTSFGRTGDMFAFEREQVVPDILTLSKNLGGGYPLSAVMTSAAIADDCAAKGFLFCTTHVNDPLPAAIGCTVIDIVARDGLVARAKMLGERLFSKLHRLQQRHPRIGQVRGYGLLAGIEIVADPVTKQPAPEFAQQLSVKMMELGLSTNLTASSRLFRIAPPITISDEEFELGLQLMEKAFAQVDPPRQTPTAQKSMTSR